MPTDKQSAERARALEVAAYLHDIPPELVVKIYASMNDAIWADGKHCGDCTKQPMTCNRCLVEDIDVLADVFESFAALAVLREREECAKAVCIGCAKNIPRDGMWHRAPEGGLLACYADRIWARDAERG